MPAAGEVIGRAAVNLSRAARRVFASRVLPSGDSCWVEVQLQAHLGDQRGPRNPFVSEHHLTFLEILQVIDAAGRDPRVDGVLLKFEGGPVSFAQALSLRRAVLRLREWGKPVAAFAESVDAPAFLVASAATRFWLPEEGSIFLVGIRFEATYFRGLLDRLRVQPEVIRVGSHKAMAERFTREDMSSAEREQLEGLADDLYDALVAGIAAGRGLEEDAVRTAIDNGPYRGRTAVKAGLADACLYPDELDERLADLAPVLVAGHSPHPDRIHRTDAHTYHALGVDSDWRPLFRDLPRIAYVVAGGAIHRGRRSSGIACDELRDLLDKLRESESTRAVVLRIESPGGDSLASDLLWRAISLVAKEKPVVVSMGDVVASGGYYIAVAADLLLGETATITGSIGVVGGKANLADLYRGIGIGKDSVERGARAGLLSESRGFTADERAALQAEMSTIYDAFTERVSEGRGLSRDQVSGVAEGRVWSGARALSLGLIDAIGGPLEALREARKRAGLAADERILIDVLPRAPRLPPLEAVLRVLPF
jgi:protease-4